MLVRSCVAQLIVLACLFLLPPLAVADSIENLNGFTRTDVPKLSVHVLKMPSLEPIAEKSTNLNVTAYLMSMDNGRNFEATDSRGNSAYYKLNDNWEFEQIDAKSVANLPKVKKVRAVPASFNTIGGGDHCFKIEQDGKNNYFLNKVNSTGQLLKENFSSLGSAKYSGNPFGRSEVIPLANRIVVIARYNQPSRIIDLKTGKLISTFTISDKDALASIIFLGKANDTYMATIHGTLIDLTNGKIVANVPGLYEVSVRMLTKDGKTLIYSTDTDRPMAMTKLVAYDLADKKSVASVVLKTPEHIGSSYVPPDKVHSLTYLPDGNLLALTGSQVMYMDHVHH